MKKINLADLERVLRCEASDSAKVTALLRPFEKSEHELALVRGLSVEQVTQHLHACGKQEIVENQEGNLNLSLYTLAATYTTNYRRKFGSWRDQPNIRAVLKESVTKHGLTKTAKLLETFLLAARTVEDAAIARFYVLFVRNKI